MTAAHKSTLCMKGFCHHFTDTRSSMSSLAASRYRHLNISAVIIALFFAFAISAYLDLTNTITSEVITSTTATEENKTDIIYRLNFTESQEKPISNIDTTMFLKQEGIMDKSANNFTQFVTYGLKRTASTLQFNMVCVCFFLHMKVYKPTLANKTKCHFLDPSPGRPQVMKTHRVKYINNLGSKTGIFITARTKEEGRKLADVFTKSGRIVGLIQDLETLSEIKSLGFLDLYADFFDLPSHYLPMLHEHYILWEKLRVCCGIQMSKYWRNELNSSTVNRTLDPHPFCGSLDMDIVEKAFMNTSIFKMIEDNDSSGGIGEILRPALEDADLDGTYCSRYNEAVRTKGLRFNQRLGQG